MIYSPSQGFVFIHVPRTGGWSIYRAVTARLARLGDLTLAASPADCGAPWWTHSRACEVRPLLPHWDRLWRWAVVRNPWDAAASSYLRVQAHAAILPAGDPPPGLATYWEYLRRSAGLSLTDWIYRELDYLNDRGGTWAWSCCGEQGEDLGVEAVRFEELSVLWPRLADRMGIADAELPRCNVAGGGSVHWTLEAIHLIGRLCRDDVERFGYSPPSVSNTKPLDLSSSIA
jgi:hypothetical protein